MLDRIFSIIFLYYIHNVIPHFCKDGGWRSEDLLCKNVRINLWEKCFAKNKLCSKGHSLRGL